MTSAPTRITALPFTLSTTLKGSACSLVIDRIREGVILVRIDGHDVGEFGDFPMRCVEALIPDNAPVDLFVDARMARGVTVDVSGTWARWLVRNQHRLHRVHMLTSSRLVEVNAEFVRRFAALGDQMVLYTAAGEFERSLIQASV